ncbi:MAG TPA: copper resistance protein CopC [Devosia sp.]|nr:copper resistance protein CopC [Devosia sp.]
MPNFRTLLLALLLALGLAGPALAHAGLVHSEPAQNAVIATAPQQFTLQFNETVSPLLLNLVAPDGSVTALSGTTENENTLHIPAPLGLGNGTFLLSYRVISVDGHPVGGTVSFSIGAAGGNAGAAASAVDWSVLAPIWAAKVLVYAGLFFGIGGSFFRRWLADGAIKGRTIETTALTLGPVAAVLSIGLQGLDALDLPLSQLLRPEAWTTGFATSLSLSAAIAIAAILLALVARRVGPAAGRIATLLALFGVGLSLMATGHASSADPHWLTRPAIVLHGISIAFWAGALLPLWALLRSDAPEALDALRRFSRAIPVVLVVLVAAGVALAVVQLRSPAALLQTGYGRVLLAKLVLVAALLALAAINRWRLTARAEGTDVTARWQLVRTIVVESVLVLAIFSVVALWRFTPPPRAMMPVAPITLSLTAADTMADLSFNGHGGVEIAFMDMAAPFAAQTVTLILSNPAVGIEAMRYSATAISAEIWQVQDLLIPIAGDWTVQLEARVSDFDLRQWAGQIVLPAGSAN